MFRNLLKHSLQNKSLQLPFIVVFDFETMIVETDNQLKLENKENKDELFTVKTGEHLPLGFALTVYYYLEAMERENTLDKIVWVLSLKRWMKS